MCFEDFEQDDACAPGVTIPTFVPVLLAQAECVVDLNHLAQYLDDPARRHLVPRILRELQQHHAALFHVLANAMPDAYKAFRAGLDSTNELHTSEKVTP